MLSEYVPSNTIDFLCAIEKACQKCIEHNPSCPVGLAKAQIKSTNDLLTEFYNR